MLSHSSYETEKSHRYGETRYVDSACIHPCPEMQRESVVRAHPASISFLRRYGRFFNVQTR
eukprot:1023916-Pyramimonas_sp.AAC.1